MASSSYDKIYSLTGAFIKDTGTENFESSQTIYSFELIFAGKALKLFANKNEEKQAWIEKIKSTIGYSNIFDYYKIEVLHLYNTKNYIESYRKRKVWSCM